MMLAPLHQIQKEDVSQASATVMPPSISQEETQNEDYDPQRPDAIMDHDFACVTSNGFSKLPSVEEFNQELDKDLHQGKTQTEQPSGLEDANAPKYKDAARSSRNANLTPETPPQTPGAISTPQPISGPPETNLTPPKAGPNTPAGTPTPPQTTSRAHADSPPQTRHPARHHRRFLRWVLKKFRDPWSTSALHNARERNRALRRVRGQGL